MTPSSGTLSSFSYTDPMIGQADCIASFDPAPRSALELPAYTRSPKDGSIACKQHGNSGCNQCFGWKKQIVKLHKDGKKQAKAKKNEPKSNF
ncbi:hypothetical protein P7C73_g6176, partial [Tremellales sp. Uapishka_1]